MHLGRSAAVTRRATWRLALCALFLSGAAFACALTDALSGPQTPAILLRYSGDSVLVVGDTVTFALTAEIDGAELAAPNFRFTIEDTAVVAPTPAGTALVGRRRGRTHLVVSLISPMVAAPPTLSVPLDVVVGAVTVVPASDTLTSIDDTLLLTAPSFDAHGLPINGATPAWTSSDTTIAAFVGSGRLVARRNGQVTVRALVDSDTGVGSVVIVQRLAQVQASPPVLVLSALTAESTIVASGLDARGHPLSGVPISWTSEAATIASVTPGGRVRAVDNGTTQIIAQSGTWRDTVTTIVEQRAEQIGIVPDPVPAIVALGDQVSLTASATDSLGFVVAVPNKSPGWATLTPTIATVDRNGIVTGVGVGSARIVAVMDAARDTVPVTVGDLPATVDVQPPIATLRSLKDTLLLSVTVRNSRGNLIQNPGVTWRVTDSAIARIDSLPRPLAVAVGVGTVRVIAAADGLADTSVVTVTNAPAFFDILASADTLTSLLDELPIPIVILNARGDTIASNSVQWSSDAPLVASVTGTGLVVARDTGIAVVRAKYGVAPGDTLRDSIGIRVFNLPASLVLSDDRDTLTAVGQSLAYSGEVRNARGDPIPGWTITWSSTNPAAVTVSSGGVVTAAGLGTAWIVGQAGSKVDTIVNVVVNATRYVVDNGVSIAPRFGTRKRPYARIQDGVNAAELDDTVLVRKGTGPYAETVALSRRATLLGDDSAFVLSTPRDPLLLPLVSHDTGAAGITAYTAATVVVKNLTMRLTVAGPAIDARRADLRISGVYINPPGTGSGRIGAGIALDSSASAAATITDSDIRSVRGYGIRVRDATGVVLDRVTIETVDSIAGQEPGAGVRILRGSGHTVRNTRVRGTQGPQVLVESSLNATLALNDLAGRQRLMLVRSSNATTVQGNLFDTRPLGLNGEVFSGGTLFEWAGLEIQSSMQMIVSGNQFRDVTRVAQEPLNGMRFIDVRNPQSPFIGAQTLENTFLGGRAGIRSERSFLSIQGSRFDSTHTAILGTDADVLVLEDDTLSHAVRDRCLTATQAFWVQVSSSAFDNCTVGAAHAVAVTSASGGTLIVQQSTFTKGRGAVRFTNGNTFTAQGNTISGAGFTPTPADTSTAIAALEVVAGSVTIAQNAVTNHGFTAGIRAQSDNGTVRIDSNFVSTNVRGIRLGTIQTLNARANDVFDNDIAGVVNEDAATVSLSQTWWGDPRGPRRPADPAATGDSVAGSVTVSSWNSAPLASGTIAAAVRHVRGDGQTGLRATALSRAFTVRVVDAAGRPVAGVDVTFRATGGGGSFGGSGQVKVTTNPSGLAEATLTLGVIPGVNTATATGPGLNTLTFTATGT